MIYRVKRFCKINEYSDRYHFIKKCSKSWYKPNHITPCVVTNDYHSQSNPTLAEAKGYLNHGNPNKDGNTEEEPWNELDPRWHEVSNLLRDYPRPDSTTQKGGTQNQWTGTYPSTHHSQHPGQRPTGCKPNLGIKSKEEKSPTT